jgi:enamine deaminase RidA (YjgF/YER057c/UK114 family)
MTPEQKLAELGLELPPAPKPGGIYKPVVLFNNLLFVSGQGPSQADGTLIKGKVGGDLSLEQGQLAARQTGLTMLATIKNEMGGLGRIKRLLKTFGMVNCTPDFEAQPGVINGFSQLMMDVFGPENGKGARSAVGMTLPGNMAVEIEAIFEIEGESAGLDE